VIKRNFLIILESRPELKNTVTKPESMKEGDLPKKKNKPNHNPLPSIRKETCMTKGKKKAKS
jgi:hypothetical protein